MIYILNVLIRIIVITAIELEREKNILEVWMKQENIFKKRYMISLLKDIIYRFTTRHLGSMS